MPHGRYVPPDPSKGDDTTVGGYAAVHGRPAAIEGRDGFSYSIEVLSDTVDDAPEGAPSGAPGDTGSGPQGRAAHFGAYLLFVQWSRLGAQKVEGHLESGFLVTADSAAEAEDVLGAMPLREAQRVLDALLRERDGESTRRWWSARDVDDEGRA
ncbi:MAG: hypothetical protein U9Q74_09585 [Gemmatimonadota bacterium]|nr:hypothetical protein [Gemmatimonadota bacterium]